ncbi:uncharacterized protein LOC108195299 isoform X2 [Daucus carota subsp. sativus]|uniref:uncharacterized protein LOC108195299 isoform X2 n=1 Tax=Daucus carota subsp. sativus TaxID=79200 RepID=UPI0007EF0699|nr:PREDICTED: uncharacterized protein LOC108195299 [Daucus carota subsp. sativus]
MAPRRVGGSRRDAALDAMRAFGFEDSLTRKTLNELLKVYGKDGWPFIETDCYKVLTEAILDTLDQKQLEQDHENLIDNKPQQDDDNLVQLLPDQDHFNKALPGLLIADRPHADETQDQDNVTPKINESDVACGDRVQELSVQVLQAEDFAVGRCPEGQKQLEQQHGNLIDNQPQQDNNNHIELQPDKDHFPEVLPDLLITDRPHIDESLDQDEIAPQIDELQVGCGDHVQGRLEKVLQADEVHFAVRKCSAHQAINPKPETCVADDIAKEGADMPRRKPCFGWISDEEEDDYIILKRSNQ